MNKKRDHVLEIIYINYDIIKERIYPIFVLILGLIGVNQFYEKILNIGFLLLCGLIIISSILLWHYKNFSFDKQKIVIAEGVFAKKHHEIPINRVKSIRISDSFLKRIVGVSNFNIELIGGDEFIFVLTNKEIVRIKNALFPSYELMQPKKSGQGISFFQSLLLATADWKLFLASMSITMILLNFTSKLVGFWIEGWDTNASRIGFKEAFQFVKEISWHDMLSLVLMFFILFIVSILVSAIYIMITYWSFHSENVGKYIHISYGSLNKKSDQVPLNEVRSVQILQPLFFHLFGYVQIRVNVIGSDGSILLFPILKQERVSEFIQQQLPIFKVETMQEKVKSSVLPDYLLSTTWFPTLVCCAFSYIHPYFLYGLLSLIFYLYIGYMRWKHASLIADEHYIRHSGYNWFQAFHMVTLLPYIQHTAVSQSIFTKGRNVASYEYSLYAEDGDESYGCYGLDAQYQESFLNIAQNHK